MIKKLGRLTTLPPIFVRSIVENEDNNSDFILSREDFKYGEMSKHYSKEYVPAYIQDLLRALEVNEQNQNLCMSSREDYELSEVLSAFDDGKKKKWKIRYADGTEEESSPFDDIED